MGRWLTPDRDNGAQAVKRCLAVPGPLSRHVLGALSELTNQYNWQMFGNMTTAEAASLAESMFNDYVNQGCDLQPNRIVITGTETVQPGGGTATQKITPPADKLYELVSATAVFHAFSVQTPQLRLRVFPAGVIYPAHIYNQVGTGMTWHGSYWVAEGWSIDVIGLTATNQPSAVDYSYELVINEW